MFLIKRTYFDAPTNHGPVVAVTTWFLTVASILWVFARVGTKLAISRKVADEDYLIFTALVFDLGQCVAVSVQIYNGLGQHLEHLSLSQKTTFQQSAYASDLLSIGNLLFAKLSVLLLLRTLSPVKVHKRLALLLGLLVVIWAVTSEFVTAFQCSIHETWRRIDNRCINKNAFWTYFGILNILTDACLICLPLAIIWNIQMEKWRKFSIACCFGARILVIASAVAQLVYLNRASGIADFTFKLWPAVLCNQLVQNIGIITACVPYMKPLFASLESGMIRTDDLRRRGVTAAYGYCSFPTSSGYRPSSGPSGSSSSHKMNKLLSRGTDASASANRHATTTKTKALADNRDAVALAGLNLATVTTGTRDLHLQPILDVESQKELF